MFSIIIATDAECFAEILKSSFMRLGSFRISVARDQNSLADEIQAGKPRYVFMENSFAGEVTDEYIQRVLKKHPRLRIAVWSAAKIFPEIAARFIAAGAETYFTMRENKDDITGIINTILAGKYYLPPDVDGVLNRDDFCPVVGADFTGKERQVIKLTLMRKKIKAIAEIMGVSGNTVKYHKKSIYRKSGAASNVDLLYYALDKGIITIAEYEAYKGGTGV